MSQINNTIMNQKQLHRFISKIELDPLEGCWLWTGCKTILGYGKVSIDYKTFRSHRIAYMYWIGKIPNNLQLDHLCRNPSCVNPNHLEPVTNKENGRRGKTNISNVERGLAKTHCSQGHPRIENNIGISKKNEKYCKECKRIRNRVNRVKQKECI